MPHTVFTLFAFIIALSAAGQAVTYPFLPDSRIEIDGTSNNTPTWTVYATEIQGDVALTMTDGDGAMHGQVQTASLVVPMQMIKSRKSSLMDRTMYKAMMATEHPKVTYELTSVERMDVTGDETATLDVVGNLTLGPETNEVSVSVTATMREDGIVAFTGSHPLLIRDYGLEPPSAMFGALRTGNEVTVRFELLIGPLE